MQNLASLKLAPAKLSAIDTAIAAVETELDGVLLDLQPDDIHGLAMMGAKSEAFCREAINVMVQNPGILPANFDVAEAQADLADFDALRPRVARLQQLLEKANDTQIAISSDIMSAALDGYAQLKLSGAGAGLDVLRQQMSARFNRSKKAKTGTTPATPGP